MALDKEARIGELTNSGSKAIKSIDPYGRHNYFAEQMKEVNGSMDGEISGKLRRPKYDEEQLLLAIDTEVDELLKEMGHNPTHCQWMLTKNEIIIK